LAKLRERAAETQSLQIGRMGAAAPARGFPAVTPERLRQALDQKQVVIGTWVQTPSAEVVEILGWSGWDFVILDL